jgi:endonuclease YncB( thermonuclease family)
MQKRQTLSAAFLAAGISITGILTLCAPALAQTYAHDGDDIIIDGQDYRLEGIDAFEGSQTCRDGSGESYACGAKARDMLSAIIAGQPVVCVPTGKRHNKRLIANCTAGARDVEGEMLRYGWAFVRPDFIDKGRAAELCALEAKAREGKIGLWAGGYEKRPFYVKGGKQPIENISCPPHDSLAEQRDN